MKFGIVAFPSKVLEDLANGYRDDPHYAQITTHDNFSRAFLTRADKEIEEVAKEIKKVTDKHGYLSSTVSKA